MSSKKTNKNDGWTFDSDRYAGAEWLYDELRGCTLPNDAMSALLEDAEKIVAECVRRGEALRTCIAFFDDTEDYDEHCIAAREVMGLPTEKPAADR